MKTFIFLLAVLFLVSSCSSYKKFDLEKDEVKVGKKYKIKTDSSKFQKVKIIEFDDKQLTVRSKGTTSYFKLNEIVEIRAKKFSVLKTVGFHLVAAVGLLAVAFASWSGPNIGG